MEHETFWTLLRDRSHWEFEVFVTLVVDGFLMGVVWPFVCKCCKRHMKREDVQ